MIAENVQHLDYAALHKMATRVSVETLSFLEQWQQRFASGGTDGAGLALVARFVPR